MFCSLGILTSLLSRFSYFNLNISYFLEKNQALNNSECVSFMRFIPKKRRFINVFCKKG